MTDPRPACKGVKRFDDDGGMKWALFTRPVKLRQALEVFYPPSDGGPGAFFACVPVLRRKTRRRVLICQFFGLDV